MPIYESRRRSGAKLSLFFLKSINPDGIGGLGPDRSGSRVEAAFSRYRMEMPRSVRDNIDAARSGETPKGLDL